jgi:hypothetical protein
MQVRKSDESADASGARSQAPFSLPKEAPDNEQVKKNCLLSNPKTDRQRSGQGTAQWSGNRMACFNVEGLPAGYFAIPEARPPGCVFLFMENTMNIELYSTLWPIGLPRSSCECGSQPWPARPA